MYTKLAFILLLSVISISEIQPQGKSIKTQVRIKSDSLKLLRSQVDSLSRENGQLQEVQKVTKEYQAILERTNEQLDMSWTPMNVFVGSLGVLFTIGAIILTIQFFLQSSEYRKTLKQQLQRQASDFKDRLSIQSDDFNEQLDLALGNYQDLLDGFVSRTEAAINAQLTGAEARISEIAKIAQTSGEKNEAELLKWTTMKTQLQSELDEIKEQKLKLVTDKKSGEAKRKLSVDELLRKIKFSPTISNPNRDFPIGTDFEQNLAMVRCSNLTCGKHYWLRYMKPVSAAGITFEYTSKCPHCGTDNTSSLK
jgi:hypothetical protein